ncbi:PREDICTED: uncharacterized protein LOC106108985 [Papilio polytes]|uniref:uncharacterized protein LOC106108985 n=1 Tax=Papilio polytes TaxID=76194 RepID=UPI000676ADA3|nr:PREDICTED: uncharacterized protein LOC106108985 [Papilio polytes]
MKLIFLFVVLVTSSISQGAVDVEKTVKQVEKILKTNTLLPRLTRDEILQLLNDLRDEDAKNTISLNNIGNEEIKNQESTTIQTQVSNTTAPPSTTTSSVESTTKSSTKLAVVLPYTPRDGSSLQELYTRPPRVEIVPEPKVTKRPATNPKTKENSKPNNVNDIFKQDFPAELQAFLNAHGLEGKPGQDNFLLPLDGFKPLPPPAKVVDGSIELPESILLAYDLISPSSKSTTKNSAVSQTNFLYDPLPPQYPFELDTSSSETKDTILPYDMPKQRKPKAVTPTLNYEPVDYDSVKVIPLNKGPSPIDDEKIIFNIEQNKRQTNDSTNNEDSTDIVTTEVPTTVTSEVKDAVPAADNDQGASISDLEDSFGGAAPVEPGDSVLPPPRKNGFYWMLDWNSFLEVGDGDSKVNIRFEPKLGDPQMFLPVNVP